MVQPSVYIRKATITDIRYKEEAAKVVNTAYRTEEGWTTEKNYVEGERITVDNMERCIRDSGSPNTLFFAFEEDQVIGTVQIQPLKDQPEVAEIGLFSVSPMFQSRGIGGRLIRTAIEEMKAMGFKEALLHVLENRSSIITWYKKLGFAETGERIPFIWPELLKIKDLHFVILKKSLKEDDH
ncbi:acyl-CoA N-acyltransferase [Cokeromyces recurvatus]|uniref:acyl-CoA N-acyltransferase n=1 Tax=Cokeromyces recurvatus TaxID=90255 RepID=UPI002220B5C9|nr:acyl-CoA N-acyltransferase [Cokeromyces recurvatus]KAI7899031.1 acyl-CoA N-acyltransferase [Cokeromyces recurvatus]